MAYYSVAHLLQGSTDGQLEGALGIKASQMTDDCWNYIFKKGQYPENCEVSEENL